MEHILRSSLTIGRSRQEVFEFFADAENLERITPSQLKFKIVTPTPFVIAEGTLIDYRLQLRGIPIKWQTKITQWDPPNEFTDEQLIGPYRQWIHHHRFTEIDAGTTLIEDTVRYRLPLEPLGDIALFIVKRELKQIFDFWQKTVAALLAIRSEQFTMANSHKRQGQPGR
ncbi:MAG: SRPBCC family protein [Pyrinomonadaceae bacterium]